MWIQEKERGAAEEAAVGRYRIISLLGEGGTAEVYLAAADGPSGFCKLVVLKTLKAHLASDEEFRSMFLREARLAARLHHPNIVQTNEVLEPPDGIGAPVIVMEYLDGQPLSQLIARGRTAGVTAAMQLRVLADALVGLHAAHELTDFDGAPLGVVHRDVSPHNLFVTITGEAKVLDFGIAKLERSLVETAAGTIKGKLRYMAPEQLAGRKLDRRTDVYAAGVIVWEALAGERMWKGCDEAEIRTRVQAGALPLPQAVRPEVPAALQVICRRALALSPDDRYPTALALADELEGALPLLGRVSRRTIGATLARLFDDVRGATKAAIEEKLGRQSMSSIPTVTHTQEISAPLLASGEMRALLGSLTPPTPSPEPRRRSRVGLAVAGVVLVLALAVGIWGSWGFGRPTPVARPDAASVSAPPPAAPPPPAVRAASSPEVAPAVLRALRASRIARPGIRHVGPTSTPSAAPAAVPGGPNPPPRDCDHPFFVDGDGIKRFRLECR